jgi:hypothetical protein
MILGGLVFLMSVGCGSTGSRGSGLDADLITREQIDEEGPASAFEVVQALRPLWLEKRGATSFFDEGEIRVYLDGSSLGGIDSLRGIHSDNIESMSFLDERRASYRFGPGHEHGVIHVITKR